MTRGEYVERLRVAEKVHVRMLCNDWPDRAEDRTSILTIVAVLRALRAELARVEGGNG
jgi:hypothetical protein